MRIRAGRYESVFRRPAEMRGERGSSRPGLIWMGCAAVLLIYFLSGGGSDDVSQAYIGPGAGVALVGSLFAVLAALASAIVTMLTWPIRRIWRAIRGQKAYKAAMVKRVVVVGLDGLEPTLT